MSATLRRVIAMMSKVTRLYATWNPTYTHTNFTLTAGNLVATSTTGAGRAVATIGKTSGKWYWEVSVSGAVSNADFGAVNNTANLSSALGLAGAFYAEACWTNQAGTSVYSITGGSYANQWWVLADGDVLGFALDMDTKALRIYKNGTAQADVFSTGVLTGPYYPAIGANGSGGGLEFTTNFGASAFVYSPPSGFNAGLYS